MEDLAIYYVLAIIGFIVVLLAQLSITSNYKKYKKIKLSSGLSGQEVARKILDANGLNNIYVVETQGELSDHYDPRRKVIKLSKDIFRGDSIASLAVSAHEVGHAIQDKEGYIVMKIRASLVPIVNLVSYLGYFGLVISMLSGISGYLRISILIIIFSILFQLVTLPVEFDASKRAKKQLEGLGLIDTYEIDGSRKMLFAAAMTYVAALLSNLLQLLRLVLLLGRRDD